MYKKHCGCCISAKALVGGVPGLLLRWGKRVPLQPLPGGLPARKVSPVVKPSSEASCLFLDCITAQETSKQTSVFGGSSVSIHSGYICQGNKKNHKNSKSWKRQANSRVAWSNCSNRSNRGNSGMVQVKPLMEQLSENRKRVDRRTWSSSTAIA